MTILSNTTLGSVRDQVRVNALQSFEFFANSVLACSLSEELCSHVQDVVEDREDYVLRTTRPRILAIALYGWLISKGARVACEVSLPKHEVLHWLDLFGGTAEDEEYVSLSVQLSLESEGVRIQWLER